MNLEELLNKYDIYHSSIVSGGKVKFNINYLPHGSIYISLVALINEEEYKYTVDYLDNNEFKERILPKILERFFSKNRDLHIRKIMGNSNQGTIVVQRKDLTDSLIIRNCSLKEMELIESIDNSYKYINTDKIVGADVFDERSFQYDNYLKYNIYLDYAKYRKNLLNESGEFDKDILFLLNIARYMYLVEVISLKESIEEVKRVFENNERDLDACDLFKVTDYSQDGIFPMILSFAEYEKHNDALILNNKEVVEEAINAYESGINYFDSSFIDYWKDKIKEYESAGNKDLVDICNNFMNCYSISNNNDNFQQTGKDKDLISAIKQINMAKKNASSNEKDNSQKSGKFIISPDDDIEIKKGAEEQARKIIALEKEREDAEDPERLKAKYAADEYARIILKKAQEYEAIKQSALEQAKKIIDLEKQNEELMHMAEENAKYLLDREKLYQEERDNRKELDDTPVKHQDIDKINNLLHAISTVKGLDFAINHPTISEELTILEEKTITYLSTHKNIIHEENIMVPLDQEEMTENKPVIELLSMIRNAYKSSHSFENDGRHTIIYFTPVDDDTYKISLYSVNDDIEDLLMDVYLEQYQITDSVLKELCDIYKDGAVVVANKIDNIPPDKADFLAIDNMNNAIKFMYCKKELIDKVKELI